MTEETKCDRRSFLGYATGTVAALELAIGCAAAQASPKQSTEAVFNSLKQINAGVLNIGYVDAGPADGPAVILLHGSPYDIHSFADVVPLLAAQGYRLIVPYLRG